MACKHSIQVKADSKFGAEPFKPYKLILLLQPSELKLMVARVQWMYIKYHVSDCERKYLSHVHNVK